VGGLSESSPVLGVAAPVKHERGHLYLSSTNETTPDTALSSGVTDTYIPRAPPWHSGPSDAIMPPESASVAL